MPRYLYRCANQHLTERVCSIREHDSAIECTRCDLVAQQIITAPLSVSVAQDVRYDSPITGEHITSWAKRREDLKRHECIPYDPEMKTDARRRHLEAERQLDQSVDAHVERTIAQMDTATRGKLYSELTEQGYTASYHRDTGTGA